MAFCPNCGKQLDDGAAKCGSCGNEVAPTAKPAPGASGAKFKGTMIMPGTASVDIQAKIAEAKAKAAAAGAETATRAEPPPAAAVTAAEADLGLQATIVGRPLPGPLSPAGVAGSPVQPASPAVPAAEPAEPARLAEPARSKVTPEGTMLGIAPPAELAAALNAPPAVAASEAQAPEEPEQSGARAPAAGSFEQVEQRAPALRPSADQPPIQGLAGAPGGIGKLLHEPKGRLMLGAGGVGILFVLYLLARILF